MKPDTDQVHWSMSRGWNQKPAPLEGVRPQASARLHLPCVEEFLLVPNLSMEEIQDLGTCQRANPLLARLLHGTGQNLGASGQTAETILAPSPVDGRPRILLFSLQLSNCSWVLPSLTSKLPIKLKSHGIGPRNRKGHLKSQQQMCWRQDWPWVRKTPILGGS